MYFQIASLLRRCRAEVPEYTIPALAAFFGVPTRNFHQVGAGGPITFHQAGSNLPVSYVLKGTIFWPKNKQIVRGYPRILPTTDHTTERFAVTEERQLIEIIRSGEAMVEEKADGATVRVYQHGDQLFYATSDVYDGGNPLVGTGIENVRMLGIDYGAQASRLLDAIAPRASRLAALGYVLVFEMLLPERETAVPADKPGLVLIDVIDPDFSFVDRMEKERIAEDYGMRVAPMQGRLSGRGEADSFLKQLHGLSHLAAAEGLAGYVIKGRFEDTDQAFIKVEPSTVREWRPPYTESDLSAVYETILEDFGDGVVKDPIFVEELMLDYLGNHCRALRWQVQDYVAAQTPAKGDTPTPDAVTSEPVLDASIP